MDQQPLRWLFPAALLLGTAGPGQAEPPLPARGDGKAEQIYALQSRWKQSVSGQPAAAPATPAGPAQPPGGTSRIQQPVTTTQGIGTSLLVPDGGSVRVGGLNQQSSGRRESGAPLAGKAPGIDRPVRNGGSGVGGSAGGTSVHVRIIDFAEEEERLRQEAARAAARK